MVVRLVGSRLVVSCRSDRGVGYVRDSTRRDGVRVGTGARAELVAVDAPEPMSIEHRRQAARMDAYRDWKRNRNDVDRLIRLREAIDEFLGDRLTNVD